MIRTLIGLSIVLLLSACDRSKEVAKGAEPDKEQEEAEADSPEPHGEGDRFLMRVDGVDGDTLERNKEYLLYASGAGVDPETLTLVAKGGGVSMAIDDRGVQAYELHTGKGDEVRVTIQGKNSEGELIVLGTKTFKLIE